MAACPFQGLPLVFTSSIMQRILRRFVPSILSLSVLCGFADATDVREVVLDNGLKVLLLEDHKSPAVTFQVWYRVGSRNEKDGKSGLSQLPEHTTPTGTPTVKPAEYS